MKRKISKKDLQRAQDFIRYKNDIVTFAEECIYLPLAGGDELVKLHPPQKRVLQMFLDHNFLCLLKSRQTGFSTLCQIISAYMAIFYSNVVIGVLSRDGSEISDFNRKVPDKSNISK